MTEPLEQLGTEVARTQDEMLRDNRRRAAVRNRLLAPPLPRRRRAFPTWAWGTAGLAGATAVAIAAFLLWPRAPEVVAYHIADDPRPADTNAWIVAPHDSELPLRFTDGSVVRLTPGSRANVTALTTQGASLRLMRGEALVEVVHRSNTRWFVEAGPFFVRVTGTKFRVGWEPSTEAFALQMVEGEVEVDGPHAAKRVLRDRESAYITLQAKQDEQEHETTTAVAQTETSVAPRQARPQSRARHPGARPPHRVRSAKPRSVEVAQPVTAQPASATPTSKPAVQEPAVKEPKRVEPGEPEWQRLLDEDRPKEALQSLDRAEFEKVLSSASLQGLLELGAAARHTGDLRARRLYNVIRQRFSRSEAAATAAFLIARLDFHEGDYESATRWLDTYLREDPTGRFAREASGRLIEACQRAGDAARARAAAERYLERYPRGPHSALARSVLE